MIEVDGSAPDLNGRRCEGLLCQQYWHQGQLEDEADVVWLKLAGSWYQLYLDAGVVHWNQQDRDPESREVEESAPFSYPLVDLGARYGLTGQVIDACQLRETDEGEIVSLRFDSGAELQFINQGDSTRILFQQGDR